MIRAINISTEYKFELHNINGGEDGLPKTVDGRAYCSGQKNRFMLLLPRLNINIMRNQ